MHPSPPSSLQSPVTDGAYPLESLQEGEETRDGDTWSSWAWSVGSALLPVYWEEDSEDEDHSRTGAEAKMNRIIELGLYVDTATWIFKVCALRLAFHLYGPNNSVLWNIFCYFYENNNSFCFEYEHILFTSSLCKSL